MFHESIIKVELTHLNILIMLKFYVSSNQKECTTPIMVMGRNDLSCLRSICNYFYKNRYKGVPIQVI